MTSESSPNPIADEAIKLLDALQDWARRNIAEGAHIATGAPECTWCPICQLITVLRGDHPEISDKIAEATASVVAVVRTVIDAAASPAQQRRPPHVQHIDLGNP